MIGKGIMKIDDYMKFGEFVDRLMKIGVKYWAYCAEKGHILIWARNDLEEEIMKAIVGHTLVEVKPMRGVKLYRVKW